MADANIIHLTDACKQKVDLSDRERINYIYQDVWINYPQAINIRSAVQSVLEMPPKLQAQCILVTGVPGMGKSSLYEKVKSDASQWAKKKQLPDSTLSFTLGADPNLKSITEQIYLSLGLKYTRNRLDKFSDEAIRLFQLRGIKSLMIDELHHLLNVGRFEQRKNLSFFRNLSGPPLSLSIIGFGIDDAFNAIASDPQLERRFKVYTLPLWTESETFRSFLAAYERVLPIRNPSDLSSRDKVKYLLRVSNGVTDIIVKRITWAAVWSILDKKETIDLECLKKAIDIPPPYEVEA